MHARTHMHMRMHTAAVRSWLLVTPAPPFPACITIHLMPYAFHHNPYTIHVIPYVICHKKYTTIDYHHRRRRHPGSCWLRMSAPLSSHTPIPLAVYHAPCALHIYLEAYVSYKTPYTKHLIWYHNSRRRRLLGSCWMRRSAPHLCPRALTASGPCPCMPTSSKSSLRGAWTCTSAPG